MEASCSTKSWHLNRLIQMMKISWTQRMASIMYFILSAENNFLFFIITPYKSDFLNRNISFLYNCFKCQKKYEACLGDGETGAGSLSPLFSLTRILLGTDCSRRRYHRCRPLCLLRFTNSLHYTPCRNSSIVYLKKAELTK